MMSSSNLNRHLNKYDLSKFDKCVYSKGLEFSNLEKDRKKIDVFLYKQLNISLIFQGFTIFLQICNESVSMISKEFSFTALTS